MTRRCVTAVALAACVCAIASGSAQGSLGAPFDVSASPSFSATAPEADFAPGGNLHFSWTIATSPSLLQTRVRAPDGSLGAVQNVATTVLGSATGVRQMAVDSSGAAHFVWIGTVNGANVVQTRRRAPDGTLEEVVDLGPAQAGSGYAQLAIDPTRTVHFLWMRPDGGIATVRRLPTGALGPDRLVAEPGTVSTNHNDPQLAVDKNGTSYFAWGDEDANLKLRRRTADGTLHTTETVSEPGFIGFEPQIAADPTGGAHLAWVGYRDAPDGESFDVKIDTRRVSPDGTLNSIQHLFAGANVPSSGDDFFTLEHPRVAVDASGAARFSWLHAKHGGVVTTRRRAANGALGPIEDVSPRVGMSGGPGENNVPTELAVDAAGNAYFTWLTHDSVVLGRRRAAGGALDPIETLSTGALQVDLATHPNGALAAAWTKLSSPTRIEAAFAAGGCPDVRVGNAVAQGCFTERLKDGKGTGVFETGERAWVGGFELVPHFGGKLVLDTKAEELRREGDVRVVFDGFPLLGFEVGDLPVARSDAEVDFGQAGSAEKAVLKFPVKGKVRIAWADAGRAASFDAQIDLDNLTKPLGKVVLTPEAAAGAKLNLRLVNGTGLIINSAEAKIAQLTVIPQVFSTGIPIGFRDLLFRYERKNDKPFWTAGGLISVTFTRDPPLFFGGKVFAFDGSLAGGGLAVDGINKAIPDTPFFLQKLVGDLVFRPDFGMNMEVGTTIGPRLEGKQLFTLDGRLVMGALMPPTDCRNGPDPFKLEGQLKFAAFEGEPFANADITARLCGYPGPDLAHEMTVIGKVEFGGGLLGYESTQTGFVSLAGANLEGSALLRLATLHNVRGQAIVSTLGLAACGTLHFQLFNANVQGGFGYRWGDSAPKVLSGCDLAPFRVTVLSKAAAAAKIITLPAGLPHVAFAASAADGAPRVKVTGPGGVTVTSPATGPIGTKKALVLPVAEEKTTYVIVDAPKPGAWKVESLDPARPLTKVAVADGLPKPKVTAKVTGGDTQRRLAYKVRPLSGQQVTFSERGKGLDHPLGKAKGGKGTIKFKPALSTATKRTIVAHVVQNGLPRDELTVAKFTVKKLKLKKPKVKAKRTKTSLALTWKRVTGATNYLVEVKAGQTLLTRVLVKTRKLTVPKTPRNGKLKASVQALSDVVPAGPVARLTVKPAK